MKKFTLLTAAILSISSYAVADNLSAENKQFINAVIKKQFPKAKYDKEYGESGGWRTGDEYEYAVSSDFKQINTPKGKMAGLVINKAVSLYDADEVYLYELKHDGNKWNIQEQVKLEPSPNIEGEVLGHGEVVQLGSQKFGFQLQSHEGGSMGEESPIDWYYSVNGKYKNLRACRNSSFRGQPIEIECEPKIRKDLPETDGFYPIELKYKLEKSQVKQSIGGYEPKGWEFVGDDTIRKVIGKRKGSVIAKFDSAKQAYVLPANFVKVSNAKKNNEQALWNYFKK